MTFSNPVGGKTCYWRLHVTHWKFLPFGEGKERTFFQYSVLTALATLVSLDFSTLSLELSELTEFFVPGFPFSTLQPQNSLKGINWDRQLIGLTSFYSSLSDDCPYCLMSNVSQTIVSNCFVHYLIVSGRRVNPVSFILSWLEAGVPT